MLPLGTFRAADGRPNDVPAWTLTAERAQAIAAKIAADPRKRPIDYEHQSLLTDKNGQPAPAAGWWHQLGVTASHLVATDVEWTARAKAFLEGREYLYLSPVFSYHPKTGEVIDLLHAGLTNIPALANLGEIQLAAARAFSTMETPRRMKPQTLALLALKPDAGDDDIHTAIAAVTSKLVENELTIADLKTPNPAQWVPIQTLKDLQAQLATERQALADLRAAQEEAEKSRLIEAAKADGRLLGEAMFAYAKVLSLAGLRVFLDAIQPIAALQGTQTGGKAPPTTSEADVNDADGFKVACKTEWDGDAALRQEFGAFETYHAYRRADAQGRIKLLGGAK